MVNVGSRAGLYARYSSDLQSENSIEDQLRLCRELAAWDSRSLPRRRIMPSAAPSCFALAYSGCWRRPDGRRSTWCSPNPSTASLAA